MKWISCFYRSSATLCCRSLFAARSITSIFSIITPTNLIHYAKCFFALEYFSKDSPSLLLKAEIVTFARLSYYVTCHMKIYQFKIRDFFVFLGILLDFLPLVPILSHFSGYQAYFSPLIPTLTHFSGYQAYFFASHTHTDSFLWVSRLFFLSHTHSGSFVWVSRLLFVSHTHTDSLLWVSRLLFVSRTHCVYLVKNCSRAKNSPSKKLGLLFRLFWSIFKNA